MAKGYLSEQAYEIIKERIIRCEYPPNTFINEELLVSELNISRTPIRSALVRLEQEHMIQIMSKKGVYVTDVTFSQIHDVYECRCLIEPYVLLHYGNRFPKEDLLKYQQKFRAEEGDWAFYQLDNMFHKQIVDLCKNELLSSYYESLQSLNFRISVKSAEGNNRINNSNMEHLMIINALLKDAYLTASELMSQHLENAKQAAYDVLG